MAAKVLILTGNEHLRGDVDIGPGGLSSDLDSIGERRGRSVGPAGTAVGGDVLVAHVGQVVSALNVAPVPGLGNGVDVGERSLDLSDDRDGGSHGARGRFADSGAEFGGDRGAQESDKCEGLHSKNL